MTDTELLDFVMEHWETQIFGEVLSGELNRKTLIEFIQWYKEDEE